jgi:glutathione peroxidase
VNCLDLHDWRTVCARFQADSSRIPRDPSAPGACRGRPADKGAIVKTSLAIILTAACAAAALSVSPIAAQQARAAAGGTVTSFYDLKTSALDGKPANLAQYKGKVSLVVNVASKCGFTPQYDGLEKLQRELKGKGFNVLGFPSNDFGGQEPGTAQEIATFCKLTYDVTFPMFEKVVTKKGPGQSAIYTFLGESGNLPAWNFSKYLVDKHGKVVGFFPSNVKPEDPALRTAIDKALAAS